MQYGLVKFSRRIYKAVNKIIKFDDFWGNELDPQQAKLLEGSHSKWNSALEFNPKLETIFVPKIDVLSYINESAEFVPRFQLKKLEILKDVPVNEPLKFTVELMDKAIKYGMIMLINYKGADDKVLAGHERVIYPMVLGKSAKGKLLLRGFHLKGWSVSVNRDTEKVWRLFRTDRIMSVVFTGSFFRLAPAGYNMNDKGMRGGIIVKADFGVIRRNQNTLLKSDKIQGKDDITVGAGLSSIELVATNTQLDILDPYENKFLNIKHADYTAVTFLQSAFGGKTIAVLGMASEKAGTVIKCFVGNNMIGTYRTISTVSGKQLRDFKVKNVKGQKEFDLYLFKKKK
jgi:hypothetical protein